MSTKSIFRSVLIAFFILLLIGIFGFNEWVIEYWWLDELGYSIVFWQIKKVQFLLLIGAFIISFLYLGINTRVLIRNLKHVKLPALQVQDRQIELGQPSTLKKIRRILMVFAALISVFLSLAFFFQWDRFFLFNWSKPAGEVDPIFGHDIGFYLFELPFLELLQSSLAGLTFIATVFILVAYLSMGMVGRQNRRGLTIAAPARKHLGINIGIWLLMISIGLFFDRYGLLFKSSGVVYGPGYTDIHVVLPAIWIMMFGTLGLAIYAVSLYFFDQVKGFLIYTGSLIFLAFIGMFLIPSLYQQFVVSPTELKRELPYLKNNIELTRKGFNLEKIKERQYNPQGGLTMQNIEENKGTIDNIRLWDPRLLIQTYRQLQEIRLYYQFYSVDIDRYQTDEGLYQMMLAARELDSDLPSRANTWVNRHLQYTHGYGLVMSPVAEEGKEGIPNLVVKDIPPVSSMGGLNIDRPEIYYGNDQPGYKFVHTGIKELDYPAGDENHYIKYKGKGGIPVENFFRKLMFAWNRGEMNILFSEYIHPDSRLQIWRNVQERIDRIAPFLKLDKDPYLVQKNGKLFWIQDAYTTSRYFPYSEPSKGQFNYIRNSVKIVVDDFEVTVDF